MYIFLILESENHSVVSDSLRPHGLYSPWNFTGLVPSPEDLPNLEIDPRSPALQVDALPVKPQGKPKNTGMGSLAILQGIFPTQGLNPGLLHCRQILYQLSHKGSPRILEWVAYPFFSRSSQPRKSNRGLLHYRWILYQLSYQGSPNRLGAYYVTAPALNTY